MSPSIALISEMQHSSTRCTAVRCKPASLQYNYISRKQTTTTILSTALLSGKKNLLMTGRLIVTAIPLHHNTGHNKTRCNSPQRIAKHCNTTRPQSPRHYTATHHSSVHLNTAQCAATQCNTTYCALGYHSTQPHTIHNQLKHMSWSIPHP